MTAKMHAASADGHHGPARAGLDRISSAEIAAVTERAAVAAARHCGHDDETTADRAAVDAMRHQLNQLPIRGRVVIGEGERDAAPMLFIGEEVGNGTGTCVDIAVDPLEGTTLAARNMPGAITVMAWAEPGALLHAPDVYMEKIAIGPGYPAGVVDLDLPAAENIIRLARAKGVRPDDITALVLRRPRHETLMAELRKVGASVALITDGDVAGIIRAVNPAQSGIDIYLGIGGAPEGVLAAAALRCLGGQMQGRLILDTEETWRRASGMGVRDARRKYELEDMVRGDCLFVATGVTDGSLLPGVKFHGDVAETETVVMRSSTGSVRVIRTEHAFANELHPAYATVRAAGKRAGLKA